MDATVAEATHLPCADSAHLAGVCFHDLGAPSPDDPFGDIPIVLVGADRRRVERSESPRSNR
jgi:hypothetical protein